MELRLANVRAIVVNLNEPSVRSSCKLRCIYKRHEVRNGVLSYLNSVLTQQKGLSARLAVFRFTSDVLAYSINLRNTQLKTLVNVYFKSNIL